MHLAFITGEEEGGVSKKYLLETAILENAFDVRERQHPFRACRAARHDVNIPI